MNKQKRKSQTVRLTGTTGSVARDCLLLFRQPGNEDLSNGGICVNTRILQMGNLLLTGQTEKRVTSLQLDLHLL